MVLGGLSKHRGRQALLYDQSRARWKLTPPSTNASSASSATLQSWHMSSKGFTPAATSTLLKKLPYSRLSICNGKQRRTLRITSKEQFKILELEIFSMICQATSSPIAALHSLKTATILSYLSAHSDLWDVLMQLLRSGAGVTSLKQSYGSDGRQPRTTTFTQR